MKKKIIGLLFFFISFITVIFVLNATARPFRGNTHNDAGCHNSLSGAYTITINTTDTITADNSSVIAIEITATGSNLFVQAHPGAYNNDNFTILPTTEAILDNSGNDTNPSLNAMTVVFNLTTPPTDGYYNLFIIAGDSSAGQPEFAYANIGFSIGGILPPSIPINYIAIIFSHTANFIIGGIAIISLAVGTVLYLVNQEKFTKSHGYLAGTSLIFTTINIVAVIPYLVSVLPKVVSSLPLTFLHIILGIIGYAAGIVAFVAGLSGHRTRLPGFIALGCWTFNYIQGFLSLIAALSIIPAGFLL
jgi:hypothetical protein